jgi:predicted enzyme related to lactoylglutathione lyase
VVDVAAAKQFYGSAFGWTFTDYGPDHAEPDPAELPRSAARQDGLGTPRGPPYRSSQMI